MLKISCLLIFTLVGCAKDLPQKKTVEPSAPQKSPYTVKPCFCMKIYRPVCAEKVTYGNSCEAECKGQKTWKEGRCP